MVKKVLILLILITSFLVGAYITRHQLIMFVTNTWILGPNIKVTQLDQIQWHKQGVSIGSIIFSTKDNDQKQSIYDLYWDFSQNTLKESTLSIQNVSLILPFNSTNETSNIPLSFEKLWEQFNLFPLAQLTIKKLTTPLTPTPINILWKKNQQSQSLLLADDYISMNILLNDYQAETATTHIEARLVQAETLNTQTIKTATINTPTNRSTTEIPTEKNQKNNTPNGMISKINLQLTKDNLMYQLTSKGTIDSQKLAMVLLHYNIFDKLEIKTDSLISFNSNGSFNNDFSQIQQTLSFAKQSTVTTVIQNNTSNLHSTIQLSLPKSLTLHTNNHNDLMLAMDTLPFSVKESKFALNASGKLNSAKCNVSFNKNNSRCSGDIDMEVLSSSLSFDQWQLNNNELKLSAQFSANKQHVEFSIKPDMQLETEHMRFTNGKADNIQIQTKKLLTGKIQFPTFSYELSLDQLDIMLAHLMINDTTIATRLTLNNISASQNTELNASFSLSSENLHVKQVQSWIPRLSLNSDIVMQNNQIKGSGNIYSDQQSKLINFSLLHNINTQRGLAELNSGSIVIHSDKPLSKYFSNWPFDWDIQQGKLLIDANVKWHNDLISGDITSQILDASGHYTSSAFIGLNTIINTKFNSINHLISKDPVNISLAFADFGIPITDIQLRLEFDSIKKRLDIKHFEAQLLGGQITANDASYVFGETSVINLDVDKLNLTQALSLSGYETVEASGQISGQLPLIMSDKTITIEQGLLQAEKPGGVIKYQALTKASNPSLQFVNDALSNYQYDVLTTNVQYDDQGNLLLKATMQGENPDMDLGKKINVNLSLSDNIPMLLRSLQAGRTVTDLVKRKLESSQ